MVVMEKTRYVLNPVLFMDISVSASDASHLNYRELSLEVDDEFAQYKERILSGQVIPPS